MWTRGKLLKLRGTGERRKGLERLGRIDGKGWDSLEGREECVYERKKAKRKTGGDL